MRHKYILIIFFVKARDIRPLFLFSVIPFQDKTAILLAVSPISAKKTIVLFSDGLIATNHALEAIATSNGYALSVSAIMCAGMSANEQITIMISLRLFNSLTPALYKLIQCRCSSFFPRARWVKCELKFAFSQGKIYAF
ncbi:hypothetical protein BOW50_12200 [Solemya velum gill symbiont]|nr:hypothetical protein BOW50_12200 [Solemya velum gill symbiont]